MAQQNWTRLIRSGAAALAIAMVVAACGGKQADPGGGKGATTGQPVAGGTVTLPIVADPTFNPWHPNAFVESVFVNRVLYPGLTRPDKNLAPSPDLAEKWEAAADGKSWTFNLRKTAKWSDGKPFTAEDVAFTFNEIVLKKELAANGGSRFTTVAKVEVVDPNTVKFIMNSPFSALPAYLAYNAGILPKHMLSGQDVWKLNSFNKEKPVSMGPFKVETFTPGQNVVLARNDNYFGTKPLLDKLVFKILADPNAQVAQVLSGEISVMQLDNKAALDRVKAAQNVKVEPRDLVQFYWLAFNQNDPLFQDVKVRQAMTYAIDRPAIIKAVDKDYDTVVNSSVTPGLSSYYDKALASQYPFDQTKAKSLLAEAGWKPGSDGTLMKDGKPFKFVMDVGQKGNLEPINVLLQQYYKQIGIQVELKTIEWNAYIAKVVVKKDFQATVNWWVTPNDPDVTAYFSTAAAEKGNNIPMYKDPKLDDLMKQGQVETDTAKRQAVYKQVQAYMAQVQPYTFLWAPQELVVASKNLQGLIPINLRDAMYYTNEWWMAGAR